MTGATRTRARDASPERLARCARCGASHDPGAHDRKACDAVLLLVAAAKRKMAQDSWELHTEWRPERTGSHSFQLVRYNHRGRVAWSNGTGIPMTWKCLGPFSQDLEEMALRNVQMEADRLNALRPPTRPRQAPERFA